MLIMIVVEVKCVTGTLALADLVLLMCSALSSDTESAQ